MFILAIIFGVIAVLAIGIGIMLIAAPDRTEEDRWGNKSTYTTTPAGRWTIVGGIVLLIPAILLGIFSCYYAQDPGEARVLKSWTGEYLGVDTTEGGSWKSPFVDTIDWNIRNQQAAFLGDGTTTHNGMPVTGAEITFTDKDGVTGNMDIVVLYSIEPDMVLEINRNYANQDDFRVKVIENDVKSLPRDVAAQYTTIQMFNKRAEVRSKIEALLAESWEGTGIQIESVVIHGIRYSGAVQERFEAAQNAQTEVVKAEAELEKTKIDAQQKVVQAQAEADANRILSESLTPQVLQQRYFDVLANANLIVVPEGFTALGQVPGGAQ